MQILLVLCVDLAAEKLDFQLVLNFSLREKIGCHTNASLRESRAKSSFDDSQSDEVTFIVADDSSRSNASWVCRVW